LISLLYLPSFLHSFTRFRQKHFAALRRNEALLFACYILYEGIVEFHSFIFLRHFISVDILNSRYFDISFYFFL